MKPGGRTGAPSRFPPRRRRTPRSFTLQPSTRVKLALVSTVRDVAAVIDSFIRYHRAIGFDRLYLFFDDADDPAADQAEAYPEAVVWRRGPALHRRWEQTRRYRSHHVGPFIDTEVQARQILNAAVALDLARAEGIDWLLHLDGDELFFPGAATLQDHFAGLDAAGLPGACYLNLEAIPEQETIADFFRTATLFKRNRTGAAPLTPEQHALLASIPQLPPRFFHFYHGVKSAARVQAGLEPFGVHYFRLPTGALDHHATNGPVILHYACCGFDHFWNKYRALGAFADRWFERQDIRTSIGDTHLDARDVVATGDRARARDFYRRRFVLSDRAQADALVAHGLARRLPDPVRLLQSDAA